MTGNNLYWGFCEISRSSKIHKKSQHWRRCFDSCNFETRDENNVILEKFSSLHFKGRGLLRVIDLASCHHQVVQLVDDKEYERMLYSEPPASLLLGYWEVLSSFRNGVGCCGQKKIL